jgi:hypothetical protein
MSSLTRLVEEVVERKRGCFRKDVRARRQPYIDRSEAELAQRVNNKIDNKNNVITIVVAS